MNRLIATTLLSTAVAFIAQAQDVTGTIHANQGTQKIYNEIYGQFAVQEFRMLVQYPEEMRDLARAFILVRMTGFLQDAIDLFLELGIMVEAIFRRAQLQRACVADGHDIEPHVLGNGDVARIDGERREVVDALCVRCAAAGPVRDFLQLDAQA